VSQHAAAVKDLAGWMPPDGEQRALRDLFLTHLRAHPDGLSRACTTGHLTASAAVLDPARRRVLLTLHGKLGRWLQLGGHCEPGDATLAEAALREATEESAIAGLVLCDGPVGLDLHAVPCGLAGRPLGVMTAPPPAWPKRPPDLPRSAEATGSAGPPGPASPPGPAGPPEPAGMALTGRVGPLGPAGPVGWSWHLDVQFVVISPPGARPARGEESDDVRWWPVDSLPSSADGAVHRLVARALIL
jgi:8-oxo-dGTP pyrophosphatase MutT (NUDIX family)